MSIPSVEDSYWDVFADIAPDTSTKEYEYVEYQSRGTNIPQQQSYDIITQNYDLFLYPSNSYLAVDVQLSTGGPSNIIPPTQGDIALVNGGFNLFKKAQYLMNEALIEDVNYPGYVEQVNGLINKSRSFGETSIGEMWAPDTGDGSPLGDR